jgi:superfamily II DNA/RNA helicase
MGPATRHSLLAKFGQAACELSDDARAKTMKVLVVYDVLSKTLADISKDQPSIVINFELPRAVEDYIHRSVSLFISKLVEII